MLYLLEPVSYLAVDIHYFSAHTVPVHRYPDIVVEAAFVLSRIERRASAPGDHMLDAVDFLPEIQMFVPCKDGRNLILDEQCLQTVTFPGYRSMLLP